MSVKSELEVAKRELEEVKRKANGLENKVAQLERRLGRGPVTFKAVVTNFHHNYGDHYGSVEFSLRVTGFHDAAIVRLREVMSEGCGCVPLVVTLEDDK